MWCHPRSWPAEKRLLAATQFVRQVWRELHGGDSGAAAAALRAHAESHFEPIAEDCTLKCKALNTETIRVLAEAPVFAGGFY